jgi:Undecaprenyl-phosphate galactose phosphotransferase WbaP
MADVLAMATSLTFVMVGRSMIFDVEVPAPHFGAFVALFSWFLSRTLSGRYDFGQHPHEELRNSFVASLFAALVHFAVLVADHEVSAVRLALLLVWPAVLPFSYSFRELWRAHRVRRRRYGAPIVVVGNGMAARRAIRELHAHPALGLVPIALFSTEMARGEEFRQIAGVPMVGRSEEAAAYDFAANVDRCILAVGNGWEDPRNHALAEDLSRRYKNLLIFTNLPGTGHWLSQVRPLGPYFAIQTNNGRLTSQQRLVKRMTDIAITLPALLITAPIVLIAGLAIKISDPGPMFFSQGREGRGGKQIKIWKLRSMVVGAEQKLASYLATNDAARFEYERTMKIRNDPRIIPVIGNLVRRTSIDELPQLWSILKGDMSLVGPRVMPTKEVELYSERGKDLRRDVPPGLTGFWQVEYRNDSDFAVREKADSFYVANWSFWLDLWIILRTVRVVLGGAGAF